MFLKFQGDDCPVDPHGCGPGL